MQMDKRWTVNFILMSIDHAIDRLDLLRIPSCDVEIVEIDYVGMLYQDQTTALFDRMKLLDEGNGICELQQGLACVLMVPRSIEIPDDMSAVMIEPVCRVEFRHEADRRAFMGKAWG
jgi:hypothetical protein